MQTEKMLGRKKIKIKTHTHIEKKTQTSTNKKQTTNIKYLVTEARVLICHSSLPLKMHKIMPNSGSLGVIYLIHSIVTDD